MFGVIDEPLSALNTNAPSGLLPCTGRCHIRHPTRSRLSCRFVRLGGSEDKMREGHQDRTPPQRSMRPERRRPTMAERLPSAERRCPVLVSFSHFVFAPPQSDEAAAQA